MQINFYWRIVFSGHCESPVCWEADNKCFRVRTFIIGILDSEEQHSNNFSGEHAADCTMKHPDKAQVMLLENLRIISEHRRRSLAADHYR